MPSEIQPVRGGKFYHSGYCCMQGYVIGVLRDTRIIVFAGYISKQEL